MITQKVCGIDVHRDTLVATIFDPKTQQKQTKTFRNSLDNITQLVNWLKQNKCQKTAMESTNIYWMPLYETLEATNIEPILANAYQVKAIPGRKTDQSDSEWLAQLLQANLIKPSYVPPKQVRTLRKLVRLRIKYVQDRTQCKNRVQKTFNSVNIRLRTVISDIFGAAGTEIINGLLAEKTVDNILENTKNKQLKTKCDEIKAVAQGTLQQEDIFMLNQLLRTIKCLDEQIKQIEQHIAVLVDKAAMEIVMSVPGVGFLSAATILAELGESSRFCNEKQVACWCGLVPSLHQSAGVTTLGRITKRGSKYLRWCMVEVAHGAVRVDCRFRVMFNRIAAKKGRKVAYVAVARKMLAVVWHLLVNGERFVDDGFLKKVVWVRSDGVGAVSFEDMIKTLRNAGFVVSKGLV
jgi:transposase